MCPGIAAVRPSVAAALLRRNLINNIVTRKKDAVDKQNYTHFKWSPVALFQNNNFKMGID
jgi:hypothetical protein